ncbi:MAG: hypothetical protein IME97_08205 [Proteobacteria bacterium]|nr:hypothetical protein [Pseudomonadota bacterium]
MGSGTVGKIILCIIGVLVLAQLLFYNVLQTSNAANARHEKERLAAEIDRLSQRTTELQQDLDTLQKEYDQIAATVPPQILSGYEDHEVMLASFLDYIKSPALDKVKAKVAMQGVQKFIEKPVPVFESNINFNFSFRQLKDAEGFLEMVFGQNYYPLVIRNFEMRNDGQQAISGTLQTSLLIPAKQQKPFFNTQGEG